MRLMMRWSPMSRVFSMEPEGMTRAWPMVPLMSRKTRATQNQAMTSRCTRWPMGSLGSSGFAGALTASFALAGSVPIGFSVVSAFTFHRYRPFERTFVGSVAVLLFSEDAVGLADFELDEIRWIDACVTRRTELAFGVVDGLAEGRKGDIA